MTTKKRPSARAKSKFSEENRTLVLEGIRRGLPLSTAAKAARLDPSTVRAWMKKGAAEEAGPHRTFYIEVEAARSVEIERAVQKVRAEAKKNWKAAAWLLEKTVEEFNPKTKTEHSGPNGGPVPVTPISQLDGESMRRELLGVGAPNPPLPENTDQNTDPDPVEVEVEVVDPEKAK